MKINLKKTKREHHILKEFIKDLENIENINEINRIIPGRIDRQQKWSSEKRFRITTSTISGFKCIISKGSTAQELFIICKNQNTENIQNQILNLLEK